MVKWNPGSPGYLGLEFASKNPPSTGPSAVVSSPSDAVVQTLPVAATETVNLMGAYVRGVSESWAMLAEVFEEGAEIIGPVTTAIYRPNASANVSGWTGTLGTFVNNINTGNGIANGTAVGADNTFSSGEKHFDLEFPTAAQPAGTRILGVRLCWTSAVGNAYPGTSNVMYLNITGGSTQWFTGTFPSGSTNLGGNYVTVRKSLGEMKPNGALTQPWTVAELQAMDTATTRVRFSSTFADSQGGTALYSYVFTDIWLEVDYCTENRTTVQVVTATNTSPAWVTWVPRTPTGGTNLAKVAGTDLSMALRQPRIGDTSALAGQSFLFSAPYLLGFNDVPLPGHAMYQSPTVATNGAINALGTATPDEMIGCQMSVAGTQSVDAQPYAQVVAVEVIGTVQQEIAGVVATFDGVLLPLRFLDVPGSLTIRLRRRSDNVTMATATITEADWNEAPSDPILGEWKLVQGTWVSPPTLAAVQYYFDFTADGVSPGSWFVQSLYANGVTGIGSYGGTTDVATYDGGDVSSADISVGAVIAADPPAGLTVTPFEDAVPDVTQGGPCGQPGARLDWLNPSLGAFGRYELQRSDAFTDWRTIARITDPFAVRFYDYGPIIGFESCYRIRVVDTLGVHSDWSDPVCGFVPRPTCDNGTSACGYWYTSNEAPEYNCAYADVYGNGDAARDYSWAEADDVVFEEFYDRDMVVGFQPLERSGAEFTRRVLVSAIELPAGMRRGPDQFTRLRDLAKATLSHVIVRDESGNRWYATIQIRTGTSRMPGMFAYADVTVTETTDRPATPNVITL